MNRYGSSVFYYFVIMLDVFNDRLLADSIDSHRNLVTNSSCHYGDVPLLAIEYERHGNHRLERVSLCSPAR